MTAGDVRMHMLAIYVTEHCFGYEEAVRLARQIDQTLPSARVKVTRLDEMTRENVPGIAATPCYFLDGKLLFLGNPKLVELRDRIVLVTQNEGES